MSLFCGCLVVRCTADKLVADQSCGCCSLDSGLEISASLQDGFASCPLSLVVEYCLKKDPMYSNFRSRSLESLCKFVSDLCFVAFTYICLCSWPLMRASLCGRDSENSNFCCTDWCLPEHQVPLAAAESLE